MSKIPFSERLAQHTPILADGAMGTLLMQKSGLSLNVCLDQLNLTHPEIVREIHLEYINAGSEMIETNTFGANRFKLAEYGLTEQLTEIIQAAVSVAQEAVAASGRDVYVAGAIGPLGVALKPYGRVSREEGQVAFAEQIQALLDVGVDLLLFETFPNHDELILAIETAHSLNAEIPIVAQATFSVDGVTNTGHTPARVAADLRKTGATIIGVNCGTGPQQLAQILHAMHHAVPDSIFSAMPNAGFPETIGGRAMYPASAEYFGDYAVTLKHIGATIIGGCCGTTPQHIATMRKALNEPDRRPLDIQVVDYEREETPITALHPTGLAQRLTNGQFTITVEVTPPRGYDCDKLLAKTRLLRDAGANILNIADTPAAKMRMSAWAVSHLVQTQVGIETVLHFPTRGRNILRVQGDLLASHALGLRNIFVTMGDPTKIGDYPEAMDGYDIVPSKLIDVIKHNLNQGRDMAGSSIGTPTNFTVGCALNMAADNIDREIKVLDSKLEGGADFALGQAVFDPPRLDAFLARYRELKGEDFKLPVILSIFPLFSVKHARFLHNEVPGIIIPDHIFERLEAAGDKAAQEGIRIAIELMEQMRDKVQGAYIVPYQGRYSIAAEVVDAIANPIRA